MNSTVLLALIVVTGLVVCNGFFQSEARCRPACAFVCPYDRPDPPQRGWFHSLRRHRTKRDVGQYVYRVIRHDENPNQGLVAKDPEATRTWTSQVRCGSRRGYRSQYISTTKSPEVAERYRGRNRIVRIDIGICRADGCDIIDLTDGVGLNGHIAKNYARSSQEVLITGCVIPPQAINIVPA